jgi:hypothetical protein
MAKKVDSKTTPAWYVLDLREPYTFCGELLYSYNPQRSRGRAVSELLSFLSLKISGKLASSSSIKVEPGINVKIDLKLEERPDGLPISGFAEKSNECLSFHIWVPEKIFNHIHLTFISSKPEVLRIFGTELYYRQGDVSGIDLLQHHDEDDI